MMPCWSKVKIASPAATATMLRKRCLSLCVGLGDFATGDDCWHGVRWGERDFAIGLTTMGQPRQFLRLPFPLHTSQERRVRLSGCIVRRILQLRSLANASNSIALRHPIVLHKMRSLLHRYQDYISRSSHKRARVQFSPRARLAGSDSHSTSVFAVYRCELPTARDLRFPLPFQQLDRLQIYFDDSYSSTQYSACKLSAKKDRQAARRGRF